MISSPKISINLIAFARLLYGLFKNLSPPAIKFSLSELEVHASLYGMEFPKGTPFDPQGTSVPEVPEIDNLDKCVFI